MFYLQEVTLNKLREWYYLAPSTENRRPAVMTILNYIKQSESTLDLSDCKLSSLPDIFDDETFKNLNSLHIYGKRLEQNLPKSALDLIEKKQISLNVKTHSVRFDKVRFDNLIRVILIPCIQEYKDADIHQMLWESHLDMDTYNENARADLQTYIKKKGMNPDYLTREERREYLKQFIDEELNNQENITPRV